MPRLSVRERPQIPNSRELTPEDAGAGVGRAVRQFGAQVGRAASEVERGFEISRTIKQRATDTRARRNAVEANIALSERVDAINADPNLDGREEAFNTAQQEVAAQFRPDGDSGEFDFHHRVSVGRLRNSITAKIRTDGIAQMQADADFTVDALAEEAATAIDPVDEATAILQGEIEIDRLFAEQAIGQKDRDKRMKEFGQKVDGAILGRLKNDDPVEGLRRLDSPRFTGTEEERQVWRGHMVTAIRKSARAEEAELKRGERASKLAMKEAGEEAQKELIDLGFGEGMTRADVESRREVLSPAVYEANLAIVESGGRIESDGMNNGLYVDLTNRADRGEDVTEAADMALISGNIPQSARDAIVNASIDNRFGEARRSIQTALDAGLGGDPGLQNKEVQALGFFNDWELRNPAASREEAQAKALELIDSARTILNPNDLEIANLRPRGAVLDAQGKSVDVNATRTKYRQALESGDMTLDEAQERGLMLKRIEAAQQFRQARQAQQAVSGQ